MSYTALYRKFRPDNFCEVKGQDHIVTTLKNQIKADRVGHAYLFCGTRGTGKTTIAKIMAKAVNCENLKDGSPCNECASCRAISSGASMNVIEIDAASNNGVDNIREIRDEVQYPPTDAKYKVYIIDEVHMLSIGAFNALLKTLEEPPSYVIFILATTEAHKIPVTILSRCQRYDFKRISLDVIADRIRELAERENIDIEDKAVRYIAKAADGAMRDALSLMDQCVAFYLGQTLTYDNVLEVLGAVDTTVFSEMFRSILKDDTVKAISKLDEVVMSGRDLSQFIVDFTWYLRNLLLVMTSGDDAADIVDVTTERFNSLREEATMTDADTLMRYIRILSELSNQMKFATSKRVIAEIAIVKMTKPMMEEDISSLVSRIGLLEQKLEEGAFTVVAKESSPGEGTPSERQADAPPVKKLEVAVPEEVQQVVDNWSRIVHKMKGAAPVVLGHGRPSSKGDNVLYLVFDSKQDYDMMVQFKINEALEKAIGEEIGKEVKVEPRLMENGEKYEESFAEICRNNIKMDIVEEDM